MRLLLVATEMPIPTRGGSLCLHRLLTGDKNLQVEILTHELDQFEWTWPVHRVRRGKLFYKFWHSRFGTRLQNSNRTHGWELPLGPARRVVRSVQPDFLLTVAYGPSLVSARRLSESTGVPLATLFMDWWPDLACNHLDAPRNQHKSLEREFTRLHKASRISFHFSQAMQNELGVGSSDRIMHPIAGDIKPGAPPTSFAVLAYAGLATGLYSDSITKIVQSPARGDSDHLELMGPGLPPTLINRLPPSVTHHGFLPSNEVTDLLSQAGALLVVLPFDDANARLARTSFSSKFADYCRMNRPIIIWGPSDAAIVRFAIETESALVVTNSHADDVWAAFHRLKSDPDCVSRLIAGAARAYEIHFAPTVVKAHFSRSLQAALH